MFIAGPIKHIVSWSGVSGLKVGGHVQSERVQPASRVCRWFYLMGDVTPLPASVSLECEDGCRPIRASDTAARTHAHTHLHISVFCLGDFLWQRHRLNRLLSRRTLLRFRSGSCRAETNQQLIFCPFWESSKPKAQIRR